MAELTTGDLVWLVVIAVVLGGVWVVLREVFHRLGPDSGPGQLAGAADVVSLFRRGRESAANAPWLIWLPLVFAGVTLLGTLLWYLYSFYSYGGYDYEALLQARSSQSHWAMLGVKDWAKLLGGAAIGSLGGVGGYRQALGGLPFALITLFLLIGFYWVPSRLKRWAPDADMRALRFLRWMLCLGLVALLSSVAAAFLPFFYSYGPNAPSQIQVGSRAYSIVVGSFAWIMVISLAHAFLLAGAVRAARGERCSIRLALGAAVNVYGPVFLFNVVTGLPVALMGSLRPFGWYRLEGARDYIFWFVSRLAPYAGMALTLALLLTPVIIAAEAVGLREGLARTRDELKRRPRGYTRLIVGAAVLLFPVLVVSRFMTYHYLAYMGIPRVLVASLLGALRVVLCMTILLAVVRFYLEGEPAEPPGPAEPKPPPAPDGAVQP